MRKLNVTDGQTDGQTDGRGRCNISRPGPPAPREIRTDGRGALQYLPSRASGAAGDNKVFGDIMVLASHWLLFNA